MGAAPVMFVIYETNISLVFSTDSNNVTSYSINVELVVLSIL